MSGVELIESPGAALDEAEVHCVQGHQRGCAYHSADLESVEMAVTCERFTC